jgi:GNAT superfamily N-acetyltransferase
MIRRCLKEDLQDMYETINDAAQAYKGKIPEDMWREPYMSLEELRHEIGEGVEFWGYYNPELLGVMGLQDRGDVSLIRHAYVLTENQGHGVGSRLMERIKKQTEKPMLVGTWKTATWAIRFYGKHDFMEVDEDTKNRLLRRYWNISERQVETSTVLKLL